ncbi:DUF3006 domain-containing protein [Methanolobus sp. ZRKC4]
MNSNFKMSLDRVEGNFTVLFVRYEESNKIDFPIYLLPTGLKEGDILETGISKDEKETEDAKKRVASLIEHLKNKSSRTVDFLL